ncbi:MAG: hypothetical protein JSW66_16275 [Phycisphaerales bacterium]|nr:MAG: hypothetical protein JSW66_16275 [Phycisphaerales bacterium]
MKFSQSTSNYGLISWKAMPALLLVTVLLISTAHSDDSTAHTLIWDTASPFANAVDLRDRANWKPVPPDILTLEADPSVAASDPSYSGREYAFEGDVVVENAHITAVLWSKEGKIVIYSKANSDGKKLEFTPLEFKAAAAKITNCAIVRNTSDEAVLEVTFSAGQAGKSISAVVAFDETGIVEIKAPENMRGISLLSPIEYGIVPGFIGDDLIYDPGEYPSTNALCIPRENLFLGLLKGRNDMLVVTWPEGKQQVHLVLGGEQQKPRLIESIDIDNDGKSVYLSILSAPGIWHREELTPSYLERDVASKWKRPFRAKWVTQLYEAGVKTRFTFKESKQEKIWRGVTGSYVLPVWFDNEFAQYHFSKKILPKGESIVYFLEASHTPASVQTPVDILKATLGRQTSERVLDIAGRKLRTHHRRGAAGIRRACTCGCTEAIEAVFNAGKEVEKQQYINGAVDDMVYFVRRHMERLDEYQDFARTMIEYLNQTRTSSPALKSYLDNLEAIVQQLPQEYERQRENIKTLKYTDELAVKTKALTRQTDPENLPACLELGKQWRAMGGAQDSVLGLYHTTTRRLFQEAGYGCANQPEAVETAQEIRRRCRECLRNPDGYEIWADY